VLEPTASAVTVTIRAARVGQHGDPPVARLRTTLDTGAGATDSCSSATIAAADSS